MLRGDLAGWRDGIAAAEARSSAGGRTRLQVAQATDCADWLPNDLLIKLDRCLMAHGVEGRTPFLDPVRRRVRLPPAGRAEGEARPRQISAAALARRRLPEARAVRAQARLHRAGGANGSRGAPADRRRWSPRSRRSGKSAEPGAVREALPPTGESAPASRPGPCCSMRSGTAGTSRARSCPPMPAPR